VDLLAGSGAIREHGIIDRPTQDIDLSTSDLDVGRFDTAVSSFVNGIRDAGHAVDELRRVEQFARLPHPAKRCTRRPLPGAEPRPTAQSIAPHHPSYGRSLLSDSRSATGGQNGRRPWARSKARNQRARAIATMSMKTPAPPAMTKMPRPTTTTPVESPPIAVKKKQRAITSRNDPSSASLSGVLRVIRYGPEGRFVLIHGKGSGGRSFGGAVGGWLLMGSSKQREANSSVSSFRAYATIAQQLDADMFGAVLASYPQVGECASV